MGCVEEFFSEGGGGGGDGLLFFEVGVSALWGFDGDGDEAEVLEVIGAGAHIEGAGLGGELEGFTDEGAADVGPEFIGPLEEVHIGVEASGLFQLGSIGVGGVQCIFGGGLGSEEAVGVVVGAAECLGFDELVNGVWGESEWGGVMADFCGVELVDHGPFVEAVAIEAGWSVEDFVAEVSDPAGELEVFGMWGVGGPESGVG
ncbi:MAG: hypothetical protein RI897_811 [Verrucomicrobiota bacterium]